MSRNLPARPSLEYLKKEAKELLDDLQRRDPVARLADAQHALAREYGFASWPKLKAHVESASGAGSLPHPLAGRWIADVARSKRHPANMFRAATIDVAVSGDRVEITDECVDESGAVVRGQNSIVADGVAHATPNGFELTATWQGLRALETVARKNGEVVGRGKYTVSADGTRLTISGNDDQLIVLHRA